MASEELDEKTVSEELKEKVLRLPPSQLTEEEKKLRRIFRNRASAERSRRRKLEVLERLERENSLLRKQIENLQPVKMENYRLKQRLKDLENSSQDVSSWLFNL